MGGAEQIYINIFSVFPTRQTDVISTSAFSRYSKLTAHHLMMTGSVTAIQNYSFVYFMKECHELKNTLQ